MTGTVLDIIYRMWGSGGGGGAQMEIVQRVKKQNMYNRSISLKVIF